MKVREAIKRLKLEGWYLESIEGDHRQYKHPTKPGKVTVAGKPSKDLKPGTLVSIRHQAGW